jgi:hypothetical protein
VHLVNKQDQESYPMQVESTNLREDQHDKRNFLILKEGDSDRRVGIHAHGGCDVPAIFACAPLIRHVLNGVCCINHGGVTADSRSDAILQTLQDIPKEHIEPLIQRLDVSEDSFRPLLFDKTFSVNVGASIEQFPKKVVVFSIGPDVTRIAYRHREHGIIIDPGGLWLGRPMEEVLEDLETARWFRANFETLGRMPITEFMVNFTRIIEILKDRVTPHIIILNVLNPEPRGLTHNYQLLRHSMPTRKREFNLALIELSRKLNFSILDMNRTLQRTGIRHQVDWFHPNPRQYLPIAQELFRIMLERDIFAEIS